MSLRLRSGLRWAFGLGVLVVVLASFDIASVRARLAAVDLLIALPSIGGLVLVHLVGALSWRRLTEALSGVRLDGRSTIRLYYAAQAIGALTPGNLGADVFRFAAADPAADRARLVRPIVVQRLTSIVAVAILAAAGALILPIEGMRPFALALVALGAGGGLGIVVLSGDPERLPGRAGRIARRFGMDHDDRGARDRLAIAIRDGVGLGLVFHGISLLLALALVAAVDPATVTRPVEVIAALAVARLSLAVPLSPSGIGIQEGLITLLFVGLGLPPDVALAASLLNRLALVLTAVVGSIALVTGLRTTAVARARYG